MNLLELIEQYQQEPETFSKTTAEYRPWKSDTFFAYLHLINQGNLNPLEECLNTNLKLRLQLDIINLLNLNETQAFNFIEETGEDIGKYLCLNRCPDRTNCPLAVGQGFVNLDIIYPAGFEFEGKKVEIVPVDEPKLYEVFRVH